MSEQPPKLDTNALAQNVLHQLDQHTEALTDIAKWVHRINTAVQVVAVLALVAAVLVACDALMSL